MRLLKTHSHTSHRLAMEPGTREEKQLKETQTLLQGKIHPSKTCRVPPVWRGGAEKALEPAACRRCGGGGQERLYGKSTTEKVPWRGELTGWPRTRSWQSVPAPPPRPRKVRRSGVTSSISISLPTCPVRTLVGVWPSSALQTLRQPPRQRGHAQIPTGGADAVRA